MDISQFIHAQREAVEDDRSRERSRERNRRGDRDRSREADRDRSRDRRHRRDRSSDRRDRSSERRDRRGDSSGRRSDDSGGRRSDSGRHRHRDGDRAHKHEHNDDGSDNYNSYDNNYSTDKSEHQHYQDYDRSPSASQYDRSYYNDGRHRSEKAADKWICDTATNTVLVKGLPQHIDEKDIRAELMMSHTPVREVRLVKDKQTGASRGFAFVEFQHVTDAQQWMDQNQGELRVLNQYTVSLFYSTPKSNNSSATGLPMPAPSPVPHHAQTAVIGDWICSKCGVHNFKRREHCFKCNLSREESDRGKESDGYDQVGHNPCNTLILRGLDALTSEESLTAALLKVTILPLKSLQVVRNQQGVSKSFAFLEMDSIASSTQLLDSVHRLQAPLEVDGKAVMLNYAKNTFSTVMATLTQQYQQAAQYTAAVAGGDYAAYEQYYGTEAYTQYCKDYYSPTAATAQYSTADSTNVAAAVAQAAIQQAQAAKALHKQATQDAQKPSQHNDTYSFTDGVYSEYSTYPTPDVSTYQYEETSGYYYDPTTGLYYDADSQYYYNSTTGEFMYWDGERQTYLAAPSEDTQHMHKPARLDAPPLDATQPPEKPDKKANSVKVAKKIAKDMAKWAKSMNAQKDSVGSRKNFVPMGQQVPQRRESATADAGFAMLEKLGKPELVKLNEAENHLMPPPPLQQPAASGGGPASGAGPASGLVASYGDGEDSEPEPEEVVDENRLADYSKMACLLCKRQFPSTDALHRHNTLSGLHKTNLEELRKAKASGKGAVQMPSADPSQGHIQYRDRAKERREKYGAPAPPEPRARDRVRNAPPIPFEQPTKQGLGPDNVGSKLLRAMGWNAGEGLGKSQQGIVDPLVASRRQQGAGLGAQGSNIVVEPEVAHDYRKAAKMQLFARYHELE